jgi:AcrR family transcriptional regulator
VQYQMQGPSIADRSAGPVASLSAAPGTSALGDPAETHRLRILEGMAGALAEKGYHAATIADIAKRARVSKRTFYEHFADKEACFIACYATASEFLIQTIMNTASRDMPWEKRIRAATHAYLFALESRPELTRALMMDIYAAGPAALKVRRAGQKRFADQLRRLVDAGRKERPGLRKLSPAMAVAVIGGINELVLLAVEEGRTQSLTELADTADDLLRAVLA